MRRNISKRVISFICTFSMLFGMVLINPQYAVADNTRSPSMSNAYIVPESIFKEEENKLEQLPDVVAKEDGYLIFDDYSEKYDSLQTINEDFAANKIDNNIYRNKEDKAFLVDQLILKSSAFMDIVTDNNGIFKKYNSTKISIQPLIYKAVETADEYGRYSWSRDGNPVWQGKSFDVELTEGDEDRDLNFFLTIDMSDITGGENVSDGAYVVDYLITRIESEPQAVPDSEKKDHSGEHPDETVASSDTDNELKNHVEKTEEVNVSDEENTDTDEPDTIEKGQAFSDGDSVYHLDNSQWEGGYRMQMFRLALNGLKLGNIETSTWSENAAEDKEITEVQVNLENGNPVSEVVDSVFLNKNYIDNAFFYNEGTLTLETDVYELDSAGNLSSEPVYSLNTLVDYRYDYDSKKVDLSSNNANVSARVSEDRESPAASNYILDVTVPESVKAAYKAGGKYVFFEKVYLSLAYGGERNQLIAAHEIKDAVEQQYKVVEADTIDFPIRKIDSVTEAGLSNAKFELYKVGENNKETYINTVVSDKDGYLDIPMRLDVTPGHYRLKEIAPPDGYELLEEPVDIITFVKENSDDHFELSTQIGKAEPKVMRIPDDIFDDGTYDRFKEWIRDKVKLTVENKKAVKIVEVTFINEGEKYATVHVQAGSSINNDELKDNSMPENPNKKGFNFKEWNTQENGKGEVFTGNTVVNDDMTVYSVYSMKMIPVNEAPVLKVKDATITVGEKFDLRSLIISAEDKEDGNLMKNVEIVSDGGFDNEKVGRYIVKFKVTDKAGAFAVAEATVTVEMKEQPGKDNSDKPKTSDKNLAPSDKNLAPSDKNSAPSDKNSAPSDKNSAPADNVKSTEPETGDLTDFSLYLGLTLTAAATVVILILRKKLNR